MTSTASRRDSCHSSNVLHLHLRSLQPDKSACLTPSNLCCCTCLHSVSQFLGWKGRAHITRYRLGSVAATAVPKNRCEPGKINNSPDRRTSPAHLSPVPPTAPHVNFQLSSSLDKKIHPLAAGQTVLDRQTTRNVHCLSPQTGRDRR